ncbi:hypothetical protein JTP77_041700, partial [Streptomyces sp. S9]|nr:hypothetical protein [Streptomyces sp. S9]
RRCGRHRARVTSRFCDRQQEPYLRRVRLGMDAPNARAQCRLSVPATQATGTPLSGVSTIDSPPTPSARTATAELFLEMTA